MLEENIVDALKLEEALHIIDPPHQAVRRILNGPGNLSVTEVRSYLTTQQEKNVSLLNSHLRLS